jgi:EmrB/QacA subfamily drug resistance transporter
MVAALLGLLLAALDQTIVATAGPAIQRDLRIAPSMYVWITTSYLVASTVFVPLYGKLSDLYGRRRVLLAGIGLFLTGSFLCGMAASTAQLIGSRALQGIGSAALFTTAFTIVADLYPPAERGKYQGLFGGAFALASVVGPLAGGFITDQLGWHWVFFINLPVGALAVAFILLRMPPLRRAGVRAELDVAGALALIIAIVPLLLALSLGRPAHAPVREGGYPWLSAPILAMFAVSAASLLAFVVIERRAREPVLDLRLFSHRPFALGTLAAFFAGAPFLAAVVFLPLFMVNVVGTSSTGSGLTTTPLTLGVVAANVLSGQLVARLGHYKIVIVAALVLLVSAFLMMAFTLGEHATQGEMTLRMIVVGLGLGPPIPLFTLAIQNAVPPPQIGVATATATFARQTGFTVGLAIAGTVFATALGGAGPGPELALAFTLAIRRVYLVCSGLALVALAITWLLPELPLRRTHGLAAGTPALE